MKTINKIIDWVKVIKPEWGKRTPIKDDKDLVKRLLIEELEELFDGIEIDDREEIMDGIWDSVYILMNIAVLYGFSKETMEENFKEIHKSNISKFCGTEDEAKITVERYRSGFHHDKLKQKIPTYYKKVGSFYLVYRKEDNKLMKSYQFLPPQIRV